MSHFVIKLTKATSTLMHHARPHRRHRRPGWQGGSRNHAGGGWRNDVSCVVFASSGNRAGQGNYDSREHENDVSLRKSAPKQDDNENWQLQTAKVWSLFWLSAMACIAFLTVALMGAVKLWNFLVGLKLPAWGAEVASWVEIAVLMFSLGGFAWLAAAAFHDYENTKKQQKELPDKLKKEMERMQADTKSEIRLVGAKLDSILVGRYINSLGKESNPPPQQAPDLDKEAGQKNMGPND